MTDLKVVHVSREVAVFTWTRVPGSLGYSIQRIGPLVEGEDRPEPVLLATSFEPTYCDATLEAGSRYAYQFDAMPDPEADGMERDRERIGVRTLPETEFATARDWFEQFMRVTFERVLDEGTKWCERWFEHPEALYVVEQLWSAYEAMRPPDGPGEVPSKLRAEWLVAFFYPLFDRMLLSKAPFAGCAVSDRDNDGIMHDPRAKPLLHAGTSLP